MKHYKVTMTIDVFIDANSADEAQQKFEDMSYDFYNDDSQVYESMLIDSNGIEEVVD
jgi:hypothetical protein